MAIEIKNQVVDIDSNFDCLDQGRWVKLTGNESEKHSGAFTLLARQASIQDQNVTNQGWIVMELKDNMEARSVLDIVVAHFQTWEAEGAWMTIKRQHATAWSRRMCCSTLH